MASIKPSFYASVKTGKIKEYVLCALYRAHCFISYKTGDVVLYDHRNRFYYGKRLNFNQFKRLIKFNIACQKQSFFYHCKVLTVISLIFILGSN